MKAIYRCSDTFHGARCVLEKEHSGDHHNTVAWNDGNRDRKLPPRIRFRKGGGTLQEPRAFKFYLACRQYNREHGQIAQSTAQIVRQLSRPEFDRLAKAGRLR